MENTVIDKYIHETKKLIVYTSHANDFINELREELTDYVDEFALCTYNDLVEHFGSPESVARDYLLENHLSEPSKLVKDRRKKIIIIGILACLVVSLGVYCLIIHLQTQSMAVQELRIYD